MGNWKVRDTIAIVTSMFGGIVAVMSAPIGFYIVLATGFISLLIVFLWPEEYYEEGIHFLSPEEIELYEEIKIRRETTARLENAALKSGKAIRIRVKKKRYAWDRLPNKTKWP